MVSGSKTASSWLLRSSSNQNCSYQVPIEGYRPSNGTWAWCAVSLIYSEITNPKLLSPLKATAGLLADGRHLANRARDEATSIRRNYHYPATASVRYTRFNLMDHSLNTVTVRRRQAKPVRASIYPLLVRQAVRHERTPRRCGQDGAHNSAC